MASKIKYVTLSILLLVLLSTVNAIDVFNYHEGQEYDTVLANMNSTVQNLEILGYNSRRFSDILKEAKLYANIDNSKFFQTAQLFRNTSITANQAIDYYEKTKAELDILKELGFKFDYDEEMSLVEAQITESKYESALIALSSVNSNTVNISINLFGATQRNIETIEEDLKTFSRETAVMKNIKSNFVKAQKENNIISLKDIIDELRDVNRSIKRLIKIIDYTEYFNEKSIRQDKLNDLLNEGFYNFERSRYENIEEIFKESEFLFNSAENYEKEYEKTSLKIQDLKSKDEQLFLFMSSLETSFNKYKESNFHEADFLMQELRDEILEFESRNIALATVNISNKSIIAFVKDNVEIIAIVLFTIIFLGIVFSKQINNFLTQKRFKNYAAEKENLLNLMKKVQQDYFVDKKISRKDYHTKIKTYQNKMAELTKKLALIKM